MLALTTATMLVGLFMIIALYCWNVTRWGDPEAAPIYLKEQSDDPWKIIG